jgi:ribose/xylose/arabinose/galactoside ABC-type transport system permease subunit
MGWLVSWLVGLLVCWLVGWLVGWLVSFTYLRPFLTLFNGIIGEREMLS